MLTHEYTYAYAAVEAKSGELDSLILPYVNTDCMQLFLDEVGARHPSDKIVMVLDGAGWHASRLLKSPQNMKLLPLPPYAPELNPVEHVWDELREKHFHHRVVDSLDALEDQLEVVLHTFENNAPMVKSIVAWEWIISALLKKSGWRGPRETGAQRTADTIDCGRAEREEHGHSREQGL